MMKELGYISDAILQFDNIQSIEEFQLTEDDIIVGKISIIFSNNEQYIFEMNILPQYPYECLESESILFINKALLEFPHVMANGNICIHTNHETDFLKKLYNDLSSLIEWGEKYIVRKEKDEHYEHIILPNKGKKELIRKVFYFTNTEYKFNSYQNGFFNYIFIRNSFGYSSLVCNNIIKDFYEQGQVIASSKWSESFFPTNEVKNKLQEGIYITLPSPPSEGKFAYKKWSDFEKTIHPKQKEFIYDVLQKQKKKGIEEIPLLIGYQVPNKRFHWQVTSMKCNEPPIQSIHHILVLSSRLVEWGETENCSYEYFFGRGKLSEQITQAKILIIGIGAVGSTLATTLTRGGATHITLSDYDIKKPENVCRSEYSFTTGNQIKTVELRERLLSISPFIEVDTLEHLYWERTVKNKFRTTHKTVEEEKVLKKLLDYDYIIDCSTDNGLMHILDKLELPNIITISITNKSKALVCACTPKNYRWVMNQYQNILDNDTSDMYNPTGCWSPTFKASYNDIQTLVQYAVKQLNYKMEKGFPLNNFTLEIEESNNIEIKLKEY